MVYVHVSGILVTVSAIAIAVYGTFIFGSMPSDSHKKTQLLQETGFFILTSTMAEVSRIASLEGMLSVVACLK